MDKYNMNYIDCEKYQNDTISPIFIYLTIHILQIQTVNRDISRSSIEHAVNTSGKWNLYIHCIYKKKLKLINEMYESFN